MILTVCSLMGVVLQEPVQKISFEAIDGYRTLLPKHVDFVSALQVSIVTYDDMDNHRKYMACHSGIVVKKGEHVTITVQGALVRQTLEDLQEAIVVEFKENEEQRKELNTAMARLEIGLVRGFNQLKGQSYGGL